MSTIISPFDTPCDLASMNTSQKGAIICKSRYGATRQYAQWFSDKLSLPVYDPDKDHLSLKAYDCFLN
jgi:hypothetical protein